MNSKDGFCGIATMGRMNNIERISEEITVLFNIMPKPSECGPRKDVNTAEEARIFH
jgi:hypothetical protein